MKGFRRPPLVWLNGIYLQLNQLLLEANLPAYESTSKHAIISLSFAWMWYQIHPYDYLKPHYETVNLLCFQAKFWFYLL